MYGLSGLLSLGYQVVWFRTFVDRFGSNNLTFAFVLCAFIGGLGLGALASQRVTTFASIKDRPLRLYGMIELLVTAAVGLTLLLKFLPADLWGNFPYTLSADSVYHQAMTYQVAKAAIIVGCVFPPCFFMGVTFPLLCQTFQTDARFPAALYAWNTLGACSGVLAAEFLFLPHLGYDNTLFILMAGNAALGLYFVTTPTSIGPAEAAVHPKKRRADAPDPNQAEFHLSVVLACAVVGGLLTGALEGDAFKRLWFLNCHNAGVMSFISFWAVLMIFVAAWVVRSVPRLCLTHIKIAYAAAVLIYLLVWNQAYPIRDWISQRAVASVAEKLSAAGEHRGPVYFIYFQNSLWETLVYTGVFVGPAFGLLSLLLPYVCNRIQGTRRHLGLAYGLNTLAFCLGLLAFTHLAPCVNIFYSLKLFFAVFVVLTVFLLWIRENRELRLWEPTLVAMALIVACALVPATFDRDYFSSTSDAAKYPIRGLRSNGAHTTFVVELPGVDQLYFDGHSMSGTDLESQRYMRLMAHFPLLAQQDPQRAMLICFGVGNTASAIAAHNGIHQIDVVDLNDQVFATAPEFTATNGAVHEDPRVSFIHDDGRAFLRMTDRTYDLVTSEPPPPMQEGVYRLYSKEFYADVRDHLTPTGMMTQWLPIWIMPSEAIDLSISTFLDVFPHTLMFVGCDLNLILVGGTQPIDLSRIEARFREDSRVEADLRAITVNSAEALIARIVATDSMLRAQDATGRVISDQRNELAYIMYDPLDSVAITYDPAALLEEFRVHDLAGFSLLQDVLGNVAYLKSLVPDFPAGLLMSVPQPQQGDRIRRSELGQD